MCPKLLDTPTQWGYHIPKERKYRKRFSGNKYDRKFASKKKYKFRKSSEYKKEKSSPRKRFLRRRKKYKFF